MNIYLALVFVASVACCNALFWEPMIEACVGGSDVAVIQSVPTVDECKELCRNFTGGSGPCKSIDYKSLANLCLLNSVNRNDNPPNYEVPCGIQGYVYSEFREVTMSLGPESSCLWGADLCVPNVMSIEGCMWECLERQESLPCRSIVYLPGSSYCCLDNRTQSTTELRNPCEENTPRQYAEYFEDIIPKGMMSCTYATYLGNKRVADHAFFAETVTADSRACARFCLEEHPPCVGFSFKGTECRLSQHDPESGEFVNDASSSAYRITYSNP